MNTKSLPAVLGGEPVITAANEPVWPTFGAIETAALGEITNGGQWVGHGNHPATWRAILEQVVADTTGYRYGVGQPNGTLAIASGLRVQLLSRGKDWARGRTEVLVADLTHASAHHGVHWGVAAQLGTTPKLVPITAKLDATMDEVVASEYLTEHANRVLAIVPATMYGNFGAIGRFVELGREHDLIVHHDNALGGAARFDGPGALTASISGQGEGKAAPSCEGGLTVTSDPQIAALLRADTDCGHGPGHLDPIPFTDVGVIQAGNQRMGEQPAALWLIQWLRALHARLQARENRRCIRELVADPGMFPTPVLWNPEPDGVPAVLLAVPVVHRRLGGDARLNPQGSSGHPRGRGHLGRSWIHPHAPRSGLEALRGRPRPVVHRIGPRTRPGGVRAYEVPACAWLS